MKRIIISFSSALLFVVLSCGTIWAQATAQMSGTVRDQSGAVLPGVEVTATQTDTGIARNIVTNETGNLRTAEPRDRSLQARGVIARFSYVRANWNRSSGECEPGDQSCRSKLARSANRLKCRQTLHWSKPEARALGPVMENQRILELPLNGTAGGRTDRAERCSNAVPLQTRHPRISRETLLCPLPEVWVRAWLTFSMADYTTIHQRRQSLDAFPGCIAGIQSRDQRPFRAIRHALGGRGVDGDEVRHK